MSIDGLVIRPAREAELERMVSYNPPGRIREFARTSRPSPTGKLPRGLWEIELDPNAMLMVAASGGEVVGTFSLVFIPNISNGGARVAQIESVHVQKRGADRASARGCCSGRSQKSPARGCFRLQLTSNRGRKDAHRFYERLGFAKSHEGMKLAL